MNKVKPAWGVFVALLLMGLNLFIFLAVVLSIVSTVLTMFGFPVCLSNPITSCMSDLVSAGGWSIISVVLITVNIVSMAVLGWFTNKYLGISIKEMLVQETDQEI